MMITTAYLTASEDFNGSFVWYDDFTQNGSPTPDYLFRGDYDGDGILDLADLDADNDGSSDTDEAGGSSFAPDADADLDGIANFRDLSDGTLGFPAGDANRRWYIRYI